MAQALGIKKGRVTKSNQQRVAENGSLDTLALPAGVEVWDCKEGKQLMDILCYLVSIENHPEEGIMPGDLWYVASYWMHRKVGPDGKNIVCPKRTYNKKCPVCEDVARLDRDEDADEDHIKELKAKLRECFNVKDPNDPDKRYILDQSPFCFGELLETELADEDNDADNFANLNDGMMLKLRWKMVKNKFKFLQIDKIEFGKRKQLYDEKDLAEMVDLDAAIRAKLLTYDQIKDLYGGGEEADDGGGSSQGSSPAPRTRERVAVDDDADDGLVGEDEDAPKARVRETVEETPEETPAESGEESGKYPKGAVECDACCGEKVNPRGKECGVCDGQGYVAGEDDLPF